MEIYIVRHGETIWNEKKLLQGRTDIELNENGRRLAIITGKNLRDTHFDIVFSSPLKRAHETARLIVGDRDIPIVTNDLIKEMCFGDWEGQNMSELLKDPSQDFQYFFKHPELYHPIGCGESFQALCERASKFMTEYIEPLAKTDTRVMIVAHGAINKALMMHVKKHDLKDFWSGGLQQNCNVIILDYSDEKYKIIDETRIFY
mgnify:FL=1|jgi:broad specificity phosphatase PhoE